MNRHQLGVITVLLCGSVLGASYSIASLAEPSESTYPESTSESTTYPENTERPTEQPEKTPPTQEEPPQQQTHTQQPDEAGCVIQFNEQTQQEEKRCNDESSTTAQAQTVESSVKTQAVDFVGNLGDVINQQRSGFGGSRLKTTSALSPLGGGASADADSIGDSGRLSPFVVADASQTDKRATPNGQAYDQDSNTLVLGFDYRISGELVAGATLNYLDTDTDLDNNNGSTESTALVLGLHGSKYWGNTYLDGLLTYGQIDLDTERVFANNQFEGSTDGSFHSAELALGRLINHRQWSITPAVRVLHLRGSLDGYTEKSAAVTAARFTSQQFDSLSARASVQTDYVMLTNWGVLIPSLYVAFNHEHLGADKVTVVNGTTPLQQIGEDPAKNYKVVRVNLAAQFKRGLSGFLSYETLADNELLDRDSIALGFRYEL